MIPKNDKYNENSLIDFKNTLLVMDGYSSYHCLTIPRYFNLSNIWMRNLNRFLNISIV